MLDGLYYLGCDCGREALHTSNAGVGDDVEGGKRSFAAPVVEVSNQSLG